MTKKHFEALARNISRIHNPECRKVAAIAIAAACRESNPRFDSTRFYEACRLED